MPAMNARAPRIDEHFNAGVELQRQGRHREAAGEFAAVLAINRTHAASIYNLGCALKDAGDPAAALPHLQRAVQFMPGAAEAWLNLGVAQGLVGNRKEAIRAMRAGLRLRPAVLDAWAALAMLLKAEDQSAEALEAMRRAAGGATPRRETLQSLAQMELECGELEAATATLERLRELHGSDTEAIILKAKILEALKRSREAIELLETVRLDHQAAIDAQFHKARLMMKTPRHREGMALLEAIVRTWPQHVEARQALASELLKASRTAEAEVQFQWQLENVPTPLARMVHATMLPVVPQSNEEILYWRERMGRELDRALDEPFAREERLPTNFSTTNFYLAYHDLPDRELQEKTVRLYQRGCPSLNWVAPHCRGPKRRPSGRKLRVAFISEFLRNHTIGKLNRGYIEHLDRKRFEVIDVFLGDPKDRSAGQIGALADRYLTLRDMPIQKIREAIGELELDLAFFTDIGMGNLSYRLAYSRLAPVQCLTWGHPDTTGIPTLDYFLSSEDLETPTSDLDYTERLVRMKRVNTYYHPPEIPLIPTTRGDLGLEPDWHVYSIPQSLFKMHPDFDPVMAEILRRDPNGHIVLITDMMGTLQQQLEVRFARTMGDVKERVHFTPRLNLTGFLGLAGVSDVVLDVPQFSGGNTTYESFAMGAPIVTRPSGFMRGRLTAGIYHMMGLGEFVCADDAAYTETAVRLGTDAEFNRAWRQRIAEARPQLYHDRQSLNELEDFFEKAIG